MSKFVWEAGDIIITHPKKPVKKEQPEPKPIDRNQPPK